MARHDVFKNPKGNGFLLDVQNDIIELIGSRVVIPLVSQSKFTKLAARLNPDFMIGDRPYVMLTQQIAAVPIAVLGLPVTNLRAHDYTITEALDLMFKGF
jgi:toxin CcdB